MRIEFMKDDALTYFKNNVQDNLDNYLSGDTKWLYDKYAKLKGENISPFGEFKVDVEDFNLVELDNAGQEDIANIKIIYTALRKISDNQATDERLWAGLAHTKCFEYMAYRLKLNKLNRDEISDKISDNYFFRAKLAKKRRLTRHPLSTLWWVGRLVYDENAQDPFYTLKGLEKAFKRKVWTLFSSNYSNNPKITRAILKAFIYLEEKKKNVLDQEEFGALIKYVNALGGVVLLDYLSEDELKEKVITYYDTLV